MRNDRELQLLVCSANLGNQQPDDESLSAWIPEDGRCTDILKSNPQYPVRTYSPGFLPPSLQGYEESEQFDIIVVGMQESTFELPENMNSSETIHMNLPVVKPIVKHASRGFKKAVSGVSSLTATHDYTKTKSPFLIQTSEWSGGTKVLHGMLEARLPSYQRIVSFQRGEMRLEVFCSDFIQAQVLRVTAQNTGRGGLANKGGIVTELLINGTTRLSFITCHLEAHEGAPKYAMRCSSMSNIFAGTGETSVDDVSLTSHFSFVMGDLNFRTELNEAADMKEEEHKQQVRALVAKKDWETLNGADELRRALLQKDCMVGYQTLFCNFPPTFKMLRQPGYAYVDKRTPSYTDRILWKTNHELEGGVRPLAYEPIDAFASSDHKPVRAAFSVDLNAPFRLRPRLTRRISVMNFSQRRKSPIWKNSKEAAAGVGSNERLQLFVSQIRCLIDKNEYGSETAPNPYVCVVSFPENALRKSVSWWKKFRSKLFFQSLARKSNPTDGSVSRYASGWPRTSRLMGTFEGDWGDEDIHCEVNTHGKDGSSVDLTGAMLRLTVLDNRATGEDALIGTFSFNLANLLRKSVQQKEASKRTIQETKRAAAAAQTASNGISSTAAVEEEEEEREGEGEGETRRGGPNRKSVFGFLAKNESTDRMIEEHTGTGDDDPIEGITIDEPLVKNGREAGRLQCVIESWWMSEATAKILGASPRNRAAKVTRGSPFRNVGVNRTRALFGGGAQSDPRSQYKRRSNISLQEVQSL